MMQVILLTKRSQPKKRDCKQVSKARVLKQGSKVDEDEDEAEIQAGPSKRGRKKKQQNVILPSIPTRKLRSNTKGK
jgi:hypothetical protein